MRNPPRPGISGLLSPFVKECHRESAERIRSRIERALNDPPEVRAALLGVPPVERDEWVNLVLGLREIPDDGPDLPQGCVPYLPCPVNAMLRMVDQARVGPADVFVNVGSGLGRTAALVHLLTGARVIGIEIQAGLVRAARGLASRVGRVSCIEGDAAQLTGFITIGTVFFLYCPFSGDRLAKVLADLESIARTRTIRICCLNLPLPHCPWLALEPRLSGDLAVYRSTLLSASSIDLCPSAT